MKMNADAKVENLYSVEGQAEIVNGRIVRLPFHTFQIARAIGELKVSLRDYSAKDKRKGHVLGSTVAFVVDLPHRKAFCPDVAYFLGGDPWSMKFPEGAPLFAAEFRDPEDYGPAAEKAMAAKRADYFAAGTRAIWDVDLQSEDVVRVYRASDPDHPTIFHRGELAEAEPAVLGWSMPVDDLFPDED